MKDVFISYSRRDIDAVMPLAEGLEARGLSVWVDQTRIAPTAAWLAEIQRAIEASDHFLFVISPDSVASEICALELAHAVEHHKRLVPVQLRAVPPAQLPPALAARHWFEISASAPLDTSLDGLAEAIRRNPDAVREHTRLLTRALEWHASQGERSGLLRGRALAEAETWLASTTDPAPTEHHRDYIAASRRAARNSQRLATGIAVAVVLALAVAGLLYLRERETAEQRGLAALSRSTAAQALAEREVALDRALLLAVEAHAISPTLEAEAALQSLLLYRPRLERILRGPSEPAVGLGFDPAGTRLAAGYGNGEIRIWPLDTQQPPLALPPDEMAPVATMAFDRDLIRVAAGSGQRDAISLRTLPEGTVAARLPTGDGYEILALRFAPDGHTLASANGMAGSGMSLWDVSAKRNTSGFLRGDAGFATVAISPDGQLVAAGGWAEHAYVWTLGEDRPPRRFRLPDNGYGAGLAFAGDALVVATDAFHFFPLAMPDAQPSRSIPALPEGVRSLAIDPAARWLAAGGSKGVVGLWDLRQESPQPAMLGGPGSYVDALAFSADGRWLASGGYGQPVRLHALDTVSRFGRGLGQQGQAVASVAFSPDGSRIAAAGNARVVELWPSEGGPGVRLAGHISDIRTLAFAGASTLLSADGRVLPTAEGRVDVLRWDLSAEAPRLVSEPPAQLQLGGLFGMFPDLPALRDTPWPVAIAPGGRLLARPARPKTGQFALEIVNVASGRVTATLDTGFGREAMALAWDASGSRLAGASVDGRYALWPAEGGQPLIAGQADGSCRAIAVSRAGQRLAVACGRTLVLKALDAEGWTVAAADDLSTAALAFDPSGRRLVVGDGGGWTTWDVAKARAVGERVPAPAPITALGFSPDGASLASGDGRGGVIRWQMDVAAWKARACALAGRTLSADEWQRFLPGRPRRDSCAGPPS